MGRESSKPRETLPIERAAQRTPAIAKSRAPRPNLIGRLLTDNEYYVLPSGRPVIAVHDILTDRWQLREFGPFGPKDGSDPNRDYYAVQQDGRARVSQIIGRGPLVPWTIHDVRPATRAEVTKFDRWAKRRG